MSLDPDLDHFYDQIYLLAARFGVPRFSESTGRMNWPERGVYFVLDPSEPRAGAVAGSGWRADVWPPRAGNGLPRIVRLGTHALNGGSSATLWKRLHQHRGQASGDGNHRGSVFRKHVGRALLARDGVQHPTWGVRSSAERFVRAGERQLEAKVSEYIGRLRVVVVPVLDEPGPASRRAFVERNAIALLSTAGRRADPPTLGWLGHYAPAATIGHSGLWHVRHVGEKVDEMFLDVFIGMCSRAVGQLI